MNFKVEKTSTCILGYQYDHKATSITFESFTPKDINNPVYIKINFKEPMLRLLTDLTLLVTGDMTESNGTFKAQLVEIGTGNSVITNSPIFNVTIYESLPNGEENEVRDPNLDLEYVKMKELYNTIEEQLQSGGFIGEKGDSAYTVAVNNGYEGTEEEWLMSLRYDHSDEYKDFTAQMIQDLKDTSSKLTLDFNNNYQEKKDAIDKIKEDVDEINSIIADNVNGIAQESTASSILEILSSVLEEIKIVANNSMNADSLNGFSFTKMDDDSVFMSYTDENEVETGCILPTETSLTELARITEEIKDSVAIIAEEGE
jgi:hypothetical protein